MSVSQSGDTFLTPHPITAMTDITISPITDLLHVDGDAFKSLGDVAVFSCGHESEVVLHVDPDHQPSIFTHPATRRSDVPSRLIVRDPKGPVGRFSGLTILPWRRASPGPRRYGAERKTGASGPAASAVPGSALPVGGVDPAAPRLAAAELRAKRKLTVLQNLQVHIIQTV